MSPHQPAPADPDQPADSVTPNPRLWSARNMRRLYDITVIYGTLPWLWDCPSRRVAALYAGAITPQARVLEIGPGTGYFLNRLNQPDLTVHLLDLHQGSLEVSAQRLARYQPMSYQHNALETFPLDEGSVDVAVLSMVLHCLPGENITVKAVVFDHIAQVLRTGGRFAGATVLGGEDRLSMRARGGLWVLNRTRIFCNRGDTRADLDRELNARFDDVAIVMHGAVALWTATGRGPAQ